MRYLVTKDIPITFRVEADTEEDAMDALEADAPTVYHAIAQAVAEANRFKTQHPVWNGDWYDDTDVEIDTLED